MTPRPGWHPDHAGLQSYVDGRGSRALTASIEAHLLSCHDCQAAVVPAVETDRLRRLRDRLDHVLDTNSRPKTERLLVRLGMPEIDARVILASPALRRAWWLALVLVLALGVFQSWNDRDSSETLLVLAPLLPPLATALSYAPQLDPSLPITAATPYPAMRMLLLRSCAVAGAAIALLAVACAALPFPLHRGLLWLLPAVALSAAVLALSSWVDSPVAAGICAVSWLTFVSANRHQGRANLAVYDRSGQVLSALLLASALAVLLYNRHRLDPGEHA